MNRGTLLVVKIVAILSTFILHSHVAIAADVPQSFTLDGRLFSDSNAVTPLLDGAVGFTVQILDEDKVCVLYEESQVVSTLASKGYFSAQVGTAVGSPLRSVGDSANTMSSIFQNMNTVNGKLLTNGLPCNVPATGGKRRYVRIKISPPSMGGPARTLSPDLSIDSVPNAIVAERAESLQGLRATNVLQVNTASGSTLSQTNLESLFTSTARFNSLSSVVDGTSTNYMRSNSASGANLPVMAGAPAAPVPGAVWYDSSDSKLKFQTSVGPVTVGTGGGTVTSVGFTAPSELSVVGAPVTSAGTIAVSWATQTTNKVFAAPDGTTGTPSFRAMTANDIPNLPWTKITTMLPTTLLGYGITDAVKNAGGTPSIQSGLDAAKGAATTAGRVWISTDTKEIYSDNGTTWDLIGKGASSGGTVTSVSSTNGYLTVATATTTPSLTLNVGTAANTVAAGNDSRITGALPAATAFAGDVSGLYSATSVDKIKGTAVSITALGTGHFFRYNGTNWVNTALSSGDVTTGLGYTPVNKVGDTMTGLLVLSSDPAANLGASTKQYVDAVTTSSASNFIRKDGTSVLSADWDADGVGAGTRKISGLADPTAADGAATKNYADTQFITKTLPAAPVAGNNGQSLRWNNGSNVWEYYTAGSGGGDFMASGSVPMTGTLKMGGNAVLGNTTTSGNLILESTSDATKGFVNIQPNGGNVGIGTTAPANKLEIVGGSANGNFRSSDGVGGNYWDFGRDNVSSGSFNIASQGSTKVAVDTSGNITLNPISYNGRFNVGDANWGMGVTNAGGTYYTDAFFFGGGSDATGFRVRNMNTGTVPFFVSSTGNVGVGTATPTGTFDVQGGTSAGSSGTSISLVAQNAAAGNLNGGSVNLTAGTSTGGGLSGTINLTGGTSNNAGTGGASAVIGGGFNFGGGAPLTLTSGIGNNGFSGGPLTLQTGSGLGGYGNILMNASGGNVGIGTTAPLTLLDVNGAATFRATTAPTATAAQGKLYYDTATNKFKVSENNGAFVDLVGGGGTVTSVTSANSYLSVATGTTTPALTLNVGTAANTVAAGDDVRITGALPAATAFAGDVSGVYSATSVDKIKGTGVAITTITSGNFLKYNGTNWVNAMLSSSDVTNALTYTPVNKAGDTMTGLLVLSADPAANLGASTKQYVDSSTSTAAANYLRKDATVALTADWDVGGVGAGTRKISGLAAPTAGDGAATKTYADTLFITKTLPAAPAAGQNGQSIRWNNAGAVWEYFTPSGDFMKDGSVAMTGPFVNGTNSASSAMAVTQSGAGYAATFMGGNVGIGTTTPTAQFHVVGANSTTGAAPDALKVLGGTGGTNSAGGALSLAGGTGNGTGAGGGLSLVGGAGGATGLGGTVSIAGGDGDGGGNVNILGGVRNGGTPGNGIIYLRGGYINGGIGTAAAASITLTPGGSASGGYVSIASGNGFSNMAIRTGDGTDGMNENAGDVDLFAGHGSNGGTIPGLGGKINITAGAGGTGGNVSGSNVILNGGAKSGTGTDGNVILANTRGNVGIGTTTPTGLLHVDGGTGGAVGRSGVLILTNGSGFGSGGTTVLKGGWGGNGFPGGDVSIQGGDSQTGPPGGNVLLAPTAGNVGIGTTTPSYPLEVKGTVAGTSPLFATSTASSAYVGVMKGLAPNLTAGQQAMFELGQSSSSNNLSTLGFIYAGNGSTSNRVDLSFYGNSAALSVLASGNVGIGTTTPTANLDVAGSVHMSGQLSTGSQTITSGTTAIDWNNGNSISTDYNCGSSFAFANLRDGGTYTLVVTDTATTQCDFSTTTTGTGAGTVSYRFKPANATRTGSSHTIYSFMRVGTVVYVSWSSGF